MKTKSGLFLLVCLLSEVYSYYSIGIPNITFLCHNGSKPDNFGDYIHELNFCDGHDNCNDAEDEHLGCKQGGSHSCGRGKFACDGDKCFDVTVRCNTRKDCQDGTDELNCGDEIDVKNCTSKDKFLCKDGLRCLGLEYTCDGHHNCFDGSDENENCSKHADADLLKKCPHAYFETANGPQCFCGSNNSSSSALCNRIESCKGSAIVIRPNYFLRCDQRCIQVHTRRQCSCYEGYEPMDGTFGSKCRTTRDFAILYANENEIKLLNNTSLKTSTIVRGIKNCTLLEAANDYVYYVTLSENNKGSIFKSSLNSGKPEKVIETDFAITSIAVDYVTNNVYFTGGGSLSVCTSDGKICTELKCCDVNIVILAPKSGWMYYMQERFADTNCQEGFTIMRSNMDGSNETIYSSRCFSFDVFMEIDESKDVINILNMPFNWSNMMFLYRVSLDSDFEQEENLRAYHMLSEEISRVSFHNDEMFYILREAPGIFYFSNISLSRRLSISYKHLVYLNDSSTLNVTDVYVYNAAIQRANNNPCEKSSCSGLCLLKPEVHPSKYFLSHTCVCDGFTPTSDNQWCSSGSSHAFLWVFLCVLIIIILCVTAYLFRKYNWSRYL